MSTNDTTSAARRAADAATAATIAAAESRAEAAADPARLAARPESSQAAAHWGWTSEETLRQEACRLLRTIPPSPPACMASGTKWCCGLAGRGSTPARVTPRVRKPAGR